MNLEDGRCKGQRFLQPKVIPLLVLIREWSREGQGALIMTDTIVLLLETLHLMLSKTKKELTLEMLCQQVSHVMKIDSDQFRRTLHVSSSDGYQFINLFKTLSSLITPPTDTEFTLPLIDSKNGVLGVFLKRCLQEYERLTFSQVLLLHDQWKRFYNGPHSVSLNINKLTDKEKLSQSKKERDLMSGYRTLTLSHSKSDNITVELKALHLAMLLAHFNYNDESHLALQEAIRLAQLNENTLVLEHSLALLQQVSSKVSNEESKSLIEQFIRNAQAEKRRLFVSTGKIQLTHNYLITDTQPVKVLLSALSSQYDIFNSPEKQTHKFAIRSSALLLQSEVLHQFGLSSLSWLPLQCLCHMMLRDQSHTPHRISDVSKAVSLLAMTLNRQGHTTVAVSLLENSLNHLTVYEATGSVTEYMKCALTEICIERDCNLEKWSNVVKYINKLKTLDNLLSLYWSAVLYSKQRDYETAVKELDKLINILKEKESSIETWTLEAKAYLVKADILYNEGLISKSVDLLLNTMIHCEQHNLIFVNIIAKLQLAQCQLGLLLVDNCVETLANVMPLIMMNDIVEWKVKAYQLESEAILLKSHKRGNGSITDYRKALGLIDRCQLELSHCDIPPTSLTSHIQALRCAVLRHLEQ